MEYIYEPFQIKRLESILGRYLTEEERVLGFVKYRDGRGIIHQEQLIRHPFRLFYGNNVIKSKKR
jgi:hypothetical protein